MLQGDRVTAAAGAALGDTNRCDVSSSRRQAGVAATAGADAGRGGLADGWARSTVATIRFGEDASRRRQAYLL